MSHQVRQISTAKIQSLELLGRAVSEINISSLNTRLRLDVNAKAARYYGNHMDACDAVITYARPLTEQEKGYHYEIAVKKDEEVIDGIKTPVYNLFADSNASDREMETKIAQVFEEYSIMSIGEVAMTAGAISVEEVRDAGEFTIPKGYRCVKITTP